MARGRRHIFEELGIEVGQEPTNPLHELGVDGALAQEILRDGDNGAEHVQFIANSMYRALSRLYHPDSGERPDRDKFELINDANRRVKEASPAALSRWTKSERQVSNTGIKEMKLQQEALLSRSSEMLERTMRLGHHALHFSQFPWSQGLLVQRGSQSFLVRNSGTDSNALKIEQGSATLSQDDVGMDEEVRHETLRSQALDFHTFLKQYDNFGISSGTRIALFMDEHGRTSVLERDLSFMMDVTAPVAEYRRRHDTGTRAAARHAGVDTSWARASEPVLFTTEVGTDRANPSITQSTVFARKTGAWEIPYTVAGNIADKTFFRRARNRRDSNALSLSASNDYGSGAFFNLLAVPTESLITEEVDYSPLLMTDRTLILFDRSQKMPIVTDANIIGLIGSHSEA